MRHRSYYLELTSPQNFIPKRFPEPGCSITVASDGDSERCEFLWKEVGRGFWSERSEWPAEKWIEYLRQEHVSFCILVVSDNDAGFFELTKDNEQVKIEGIGLLPSFRGRGFGGGLLSRATQEAYDWHGRRVWLHTATDDHPNALPNYLNRGYRIYHEEPLTNPMQIDERSG